MTRPLGHPLLIAFPCPGGHRRPPGFALAHRWLPPARGPRGVIGDLLHWAQPQFPAFLPNGPINSLKLPSQDPPAKV